MGTTHRVIVVDDSALTLQTTVAALTAAGMEAKAVGSHHVFSLTQEIDKYQPTLVLIDLRMPALRGDQVVDIVRRQAKHQCALVLFSAADEAELKQLSAAAGADGFIQKTGNTDDLVNAIRTRF